MPDVSGLDAVTKNRLAHWLRSERAFGLTAVQAAHFAVDAENQQHVSQAIGEPVSPGVVTGPVASDAHARAVPGQSAPRAGAEVDVAKRPAASRSSAMDEPVLIPPPSVPGFTAPLLGRDEKVVRLAALDENEVRGCTKCRLCETRTKTVFGEGDPDAKIFFIGEGPGENEDLQGRPFVGRAGQLLDKMIAGMGLKREQVFIGNIVKCRPPGNRVPATDEVATCTPYLERQLEIVRPQVIVTLGRPSANYMLQNKLSMGAMRGQWQSWRGIKLMPTFHPSYVLRTYTEEVRATVWGDLKKVMAEVGLAPLKRGGVS